MEIKRVIYKKRLQRTNVMQKLQQFGVDREILLLFCRSVVESFPTFCFLAWYFLTVCINKTKHDTFVNIFSKSWGPQQHSMTLPSEFQVVRERVTSPLR